MNVWITVSHPLVSQVQTIGDIVRLKTIAEALGTLGHRAEIIACRDAEAGDQSPSLSSEESKNHVGRPLPGVPRHGVTAGRRRSFARTVRSHLSPHAILYRAPRRHVPHDMMTLLASDGRFVQL